MGCDIHIHRERLVDGQWESADVWTEEEDDESPYISHKDAGYHGRDYELFGLLAGVRRDFGDRSLPEKGMPDDASTEVAEACKSWDIDGHSHSHLDIQELKEQMMLNTLDPLTADMFRPLQEILNSLKDLGGENQRIVFWFDN